MVSTIDEGLLQVADLDGGPLDGGRRRAEELPAGDRRDAVGHAVNLPALGPGWCHDVDCPGNLFGQPVVAERAVVADVHWLGDVGGDEVLMGRVHGLLAGRERDDEVCSRKEPVEPSLLRESGRDLPGGVRSDLQGRLDVVDRDDLVALSGKPRERADSPELRALPTTLRLF